VALTQNDDGGDVFLVVSASLPGIKEEIYTCQVTKKLAAKKKTKEWEKFISKESSWPQFFFAYGLALPFTSPYVFSFFDRTLFFLNYFQLIFDLVRSSVPDSSNLELTITDKSGKVAYVASLWSRVRVRVVS